MNTSSPTTPVWQKKTSNLRPLSSSLASRPGHLGSPHAPSFTGQSPSSFNNGKLSTEDSKSINNGNNNNLFGYGSQVPMPHLSSPGISFGSPSSNGLNSPKITSGTISDSSNANKSISALLTPGNSQAQVSLNRYSELDSKIQDMDINLQQQKAIRRKQRAKMEILSITTESTQKRLQNVEERNDKLVERLAQIDKCKFLTFVQFAMIVASYLVYHFSYYAITYSHSVREEYPRSY